MFSRVHETSSIAGSPDLEGLYERGLIVDISLDNFDTLCGEFIRILAVWIACECSGFVEVALQRCFDARTA